MDRRTALDDLEKLGIDLVAQLMPPVLNAMLRVVCTKTHAVVLPLRDNRGQIYCVSTQDTDLGGGK